MGGICSVMCAKHNDTFKKETMLKKHDDTEHTKGRVQLKKSRIRETKNLTTYADSRTDTVLERLRDLSKKKIIKK